MRCYICSRKLIDMNHETGKEICHNCEKNINEEKKENKNVKTNRNKRH